MNAPFVPHIRPNASREEVGQIIQAAVQHYSAQIMDLINKTHPADLPVLIACADSIRAAMTITHPEAFRYADRIKRNMITITAARPGGSHDGRQE